MPRTTDSSWKLAYSAKHPDRSIPEPKHRVAPQGVTAGISFRAMPKSCVEQVRDICLYYVDKCSGKYTNNAAAARYVHQMADEVINQLAGVASDIKRHVDEPEVLQKLLDEWNESFPASLGDIGTPKAIAAKLEKQRRQIEDLEQTLEQERKLHDSDIAGILRSVDAQLDASRRGVQSERRQLAIKTQHSADQQAQTTAELTARYEAQLNTLRESTRAEIQSSAISHSREMDALKAKLSQVEEDARIEKSLFTATLAKEKSRHNRSSAKAAKKYKELSEKYENLRSGAMLAESTVDESGKVVISPGGGTSLGTKSGLVRDGMRDGEWVSANLAVGTAGSGSPMGEKSVASTETGLSSFDRSSYPSSPGGAMDRQGSIVARLRQVSAFL